MLIDGNETHNGTTDINGALNIIGTESLIGSGTILGTQTLTGLSTIIGTQNIFGLQTILGTEIVNGVDSINGNLVVTSDADYVAKFKNTSNRNGISIQLNNSVPDLNNRFISFRDGSDNPVGRIVGESPTDLLLSSRIIRALYDMGIDLLLVAGKSAAHTGFAYDFYETFLDAADGAWVTFKFGREISDWTGNRGITYESGSGDYAEWLKKESYSEKFSYGDVVSVNGGVISKRTDNSDHCMVISMAPIVLGNMPPKDQESNYEKVAFMGQVPVKVKGIVNIGDYIIPSGDNDGLAIAVTKSKMNIQQFKKIIGVAWSSSFVTTSFSFSFINVAIGITSNSLVDKIEEQEKEISLLKDGLNNIGNYLTSKDPTFKVKKFDDTNKFVEVSKDIPKIDEHPLYDQNNLETLKKILLKNQSMLTNILAGARKELETRNINIENFPKIKQLLNDPIYFVNSLGNDLSYFK